MEAPPAPTSFDIPEVEAIDLSDLLDRLRPGLVRSVRAITRDVDAAEEISQDALLRLAMRIRGGQHPDDPAAWLHRVGHNLAISRGRRIQVARRAAGRIVRHNDAASVEERAVERERSATMRRLFAELRQEDQRILTLSAMGLPGRQIAASAGLSYVALRARICRLRARLQQALADLDPALSAPANAMPTGRSYDRREWTEAGHLASVAGLSSRASRQLSSASAAAARP